MGISWRHVEVFFFFNYLKRTLPFEEKNSILIFLEKNFAWNSLKNFQKVQWCHLKLKRNIIVQYQQLIKSKFLQSINGLRLYLLMIYKHLTIKETPSRLKKNQLNVKKPYITKKSLLIHHLNRFSFKSTQFPLINKRTYHRWP